jgi:hypothetical protein
MGWIVHSWKTQGKAHHAGYPTDIVLHISDATAKDGMNNPHRTINSSNHQVRRLLFVVAGLVPGR